MSELSEKLLNLDISEGIFKDIKYFISGEVHEKIEVLLKSGGAERQNYISDYVTHLIAGKNPEENDIADANDVYEIPTVTPRWIFMCAILKRRIDTQPYLFTVDSKLFSGRTFCFSNIREDLNILWGLITFNGGFVHLKLNRQCDYLVTGVTDSAKYEKAYLLGSDKIKIVTPDWVVEAVRCKRLPDPALYHPKLINWPKPVKPPEPTTLITGFDEEASESADKTEEKTLPDSTQALLERLKQRMPWNQPPPTSSPVSVSSSSETVAPPNVVAPSFLSKMQANQRELAGQFKSPVRQGQQQISAGFSFDIHHPPTSQQQMSQQINMQNAQMTINRLLNQQQANKPGLQQIRGQLNPSQMQQQLMQQRMQQQQQNIIQRSPNQINQQLLHQQLSQGQRQVLQNQLMNQQSLQQQQQQQQNLININQDSQGLDSGMFSPQPNQFNQATQQLDLNHQRNQIDHSPSPNQVMTSPQHSQSQLLSPQHQHQIQNQLLNQQQQQNHIPVSQLQQNNNQLITQQQQIQLSQQQARANQLLQTQNQINLQQDRVNQLLSQQTQNQLLQQQKQGNQQQQQQQQQHMHQQNHEVELLAQSPQNHLMQPNQLMQHNQPSQEMLQQNHQIMQQQNQMIQSQNPQMAQQNQPIIRQGQVINQQPQQQLLGHNNQGGQQTLLSLPPNHHLSQLSPQQIQQLQQLKREQQQLLNQTQNQMVSQQQNVVLNQQHVQPNQLGQNQQQIMGQISQQQQIQIQNRVIQQQNLNQLQQQNFSPPPMNQHGMVQKQQIFNQVSTGQNQQIQTNQFINQNQFEAIQQQNKLNHGGNQMNVQALNQQLQQQNLGQQLNQQLLQQNQPQPVVNQPGMGLDQGMMINQQQAPVVNQPNSLGMNQINPAVNQQVIRGQFPQQVLVNQGQPGAVQRAQLNPQVWAQQQQQPQTAGGPLQGPQIIRHPVNVSVQQSPTNGAVGPRIQWPPGQQPGVPQRRFIQLDAHTHNQLQKMTPEQQAVFVTKLQKQRQLQLAKQMQGAGGHILIRGNVPQGLTPQQQVQWLQQQAKQQGIVLPPNIQQNLTAGNITPQQTTPPAVAPPQHAPGLSPINQPTPAAPPTQQFVPEQPTAQQLQLRQQYRLQMQREQAQKNAALTQQVSGPIPTQTMVRPPLSQTPAVDSTTNPQVQVNPKTKTALANMLSIKLQSGGTIGPPVRPEGIPEQSAAGTLRMMTAQHNAAINSKPQEIIALHQRRVITGPGGEIIKPPGVSALPMTPQNEPPKMQFNQGKAPVPVQHRVGPFYGHNPNLKLPPDLFLLGCIFVVVEVEDYLEEKLPGWQQKIEKYGGEVEKQYCSKVTHVLCETQRHGVVMQALRDVKRCVTIRWLSDVIKRKQVLPPWTALHLPQIYLDIAPASKHLISISGFEGNLRQIVKQMILYTGAKCTNYFSKHNTLLICAKEEGKKYAYAKKWGIPVVNVQWLTDVILGNYTAMNQMDNQAYQTYSNPPNLSFDPKLVPTMMHAWKAPINISQESYERVKRSASPVSLPKVKKQKTEHTDENENITEEVPANPNYKILLSQFDGPRTKELEAAIRELGGIVAKDHTDFTHLVMPNLARSHKLLFAITKFCHILPDKWLEHSLSSRTFLPETDFTLAADEFNRTFNTNLDLVLKSPLKSRLLDGKSFWITPSVAPRKKLLAELIELSGGKVERVRRSRAQIEAANLTAPSTYFIVTAKEDLHLVGDLLRNKKDKQRVVCNAELVLSAILRQEFDVEPYAVSVA